MTSYWSLVIGITMKLDESPSQCTDNSLYLYCTGCISTDNTNKVSLSYLA